MYVPGLSLAQVSEPLPGAVVVAASISEPKDLTRWPCTGGVNLGDALPLPTKVVKSWPGWSGLAIVVGVPSPPPSWPSTTIDVGTGSAFVKLMVRVSPTGTVIVGPGVHPPLQPVADKVPPESLVIGTTGGVAVVLADGAQNCHIRTDRPSGSVAIARCAVRLTVVAAVVRPATNKLVAARAALRIIFM
jgi:hypothetical protein